jgi:hypothetical protein
MHRDICSRSIFIVAAFVWLALFGTIAIGQAILVERTTLSEKTPDQMVSDQEERQDQRAASLATAAIGVDGEPLPLASI